MTRQRRMGLAARRAFASFAIALMLLSTVPHPALAQEAPPAAPATPFEVANLAIRIEEEVSSNYSATGLVNTTATGRIIVNNPLNRTLSNVALKLNATAATDLPVNRVVTVPLLPPNESVVAIYNITAPPRLVLSHDWRSITYQQAIGEFLQGRDVSGEALDVALDSRRLLDGVDNLLEFNVTVGNAWTRDIASVTLEDLLPAAVVNASLAAGGAAYDAANNTALVPLLAAGQNATLTFQATLPASAFADPEASTIDMRHAVRAGYALSQEFAQEPLDLGRIQQIQAGKVAQAVTEEASLQQQFELPELTEIVDQLDAATGLPDVLNATAFQRAAALGIPLDNATFAAELERQARERAGEVLGTMDSALNLTRDRFGRFVEAQAKQAAALVREGKEMQNLLDSMGFQPNRTRAQERFDKIVNEGFDPEEVADLQANFSLTPEDINATRRWVADHRDELVNGSLSRTYRLVARESWNGTVAQVDTATAALENSVYWNTFYNRTRPLEDQFTALTRYTQLSGAVRDNLSSGNWSYVQTTAAELAPLSWNLALSTGEFRFVDAYRNASIAGAAATVALGGDPGLAENVTEGLEFHSHVFISLDEQPGTPSVITSPTPTYTFKFTALATQPGSVFPPTHALIRVERVDISLSGEETFTRICTFPIAFSGPSIERRECTVNLDKFETRWLAFAFVCDTPCGDPPSGPLHQFFSFQSGDFITIRQGLPGTASVFVDSTPRGASVQIGPHSGVTPQGFASLTPGPYSIDVTKSGFNPAGVDAILLADRLNQFFFNLAAQTADIGVTVIGARGELISGAAVVARNIATNQINGPCITADGACTLTKLPAGGYEVLATKEGKTVFRTFVFVGKGEVKGVEARLLNAVREQFKSFLNIQSLAVLEDFADTSYTILGKGAFGGAARGFKETLLGGFCGEVCLQSDAQILRHANMEFVTGLILGPAGVTNDIEAGGKDEISQLTDALNRGDTTDTIKKLVLLALTIAPIPEEALTKMFSPIQKLLRGTKTAARVGDAARAVEGVLTEVQGLVRAGLHLPSVLKLRKLGMEWEAILDMAKQGWNLRLFADEFAKFPAQVQRGLAEALKIRSEGGDMLWRVEDFFSHWSDHADEWISLLGSRIELDEYAKLSTSLFKRREGVKVFIQTDIDKLNLAIYDPVDKVLVTGGRDGNFFQTMFRPDPGYIEGRLLSGKMRQLL